MSTHKQARPRGNSTGPLQQNDVTESAPTTVTRVGAHVTDAGHGSIRRAPRPERDWFPVRNELARDQQLSYRARGVLVAILSRPDDWRTDSSQLAREGKEGREAVRAALRELEEAGYLRRRKVRGEKGRFYLETVIYDVPQPLDDTAAADDIGPGQTSDGIPGAGGPGAGRPGAGSPGAGFLGAIQKTETKNRDEEEPSLTDALPLPDLVTPRGATESATTKSTRTLDEQFADLWAVYPRKVGKQAARKVWDRARRTTDPAVILDGARRFAEASRATEARFIPHPSTWLARGGWEDELDAVQPAADARGAGAWAFMQGQPPRPPGSSVWDREPTRARPAPRLTDAEIRDRALNPALYDTRSA